MAYKFSKNDIDEFKNKFNLTEYNLNEFKNKEFNLSDCDLKNLLDINVNPNLLLEIRSFYEYSNDFKCYLDEHDCIINEEVLFSKNPIMNIFSYGFKFNNLKKNNLDYCIYNPYIIDYIIDNPDECEYIFCEDILDINISNIYDYIISKEFYDIIIEYKYLYSKCNRLWNMWLNINPHSIDLLFTDNILDLNFVSLNPKCFEIFEKYKNTENYDEMCDYLNIYILSANPSIMNYNYDNIKERTHNIKDKLLKNLYHPNKISKFINIHGIEKIDEYLN